MSQPIIEVENLSKRYHLGAIGATTVRDTLQRAWQRLRGCAPEAKTGEFWALRDVSFTVQPGEVLGVIGRNGAGKSTLLKILSRITEPTSGRAILRGRVSSLLEVGTGFHPELSGRDNIFLNGAILGMTQAEIRRKFDEIVAFAEVEKFLDTPVKRYSSGMYVRLAFAVAAHLDPEILIVDEVLAVGDASFQKKCLGKMHDVSTRDGRTVLFVSHSMQAITTLCTRALIVEKGRLAGIGPPNEMAVQYLGATEGVHGQTLWRGDVGDESFRLKLARVSGGVNGVFATHEPLRIQIVGEVLQPILGFICAVEVYSGHRQLLAYSAHDDSAPPPPPVMPVGPFACELTIPGDTLASGSYEFHVDIGVHNIKRIVTERISFPVTLENTRGIGRRYQSNWTHCFRPNWPWRRLSEEETRQISSI